MFGLGWSEMVLIGIVALIVIGPKDLPNMFRTMGQATGKMRAMAREFSRAMEAAADESGVKEISSSLKAAANPQKFGVDKLREATGMTYKPGTETAKLSAERQAAKDKILNATAKAATDRQARETAEKAATPVPPPTTPAPSATTPAPKAPRAKAAGAQTGNAQTAGAKATGAKTASPKPTRAKAATADAPATPPRKPAARKPKAATPTGDA